jgi:hypothetical protein
MLEFGLAWQQRVDVTSALPPMSVPTLVLRRRDNRYHRAASGMWIVDRIPGAAWVGLDGADSHPFHVGYFTEILVRVEDAGTGQVVPVASHRRVVTVLFTVVVASTGRAAGLGYEARLDMLEEANRICHRQIERLGGTAIRSTGDGYLAMSDGPAGAVTTASAILGEVRGLGIAMRTGLHPGEITLHDDAVGALGFTSRRG